MNSVRCVSFCAVSSIGQAAEDKESLPEQREQNRKFIENLGNIYPGHSGILVDTIEIVGSRSIVLYSDALKAHAGYRKLDELIRENKFDVLVCRDRTRLGRNNALIITLERLCEQHNILVIPRHGNRPSSLTEDQSESTILLSNFEAAQAQIEIKRLQHRQEMGMQSRVMRRKLFSSRPNYGYRYTYDHGEISGIEIVPEEARVFRRIFVDLYLKQGLGTPAIASIVNNDGIPSPTGKNWSSAYLLQCLRYIDIWAGYLFLNHKSTSGRQKERVKGQHEPIISEDELLAIKKERKQRTRKKVLPKRLFAGSCVCLQCNAMMVGGYTTSGSRKIPTMVCRICSASVAEWKVLEELRVLVEEEFSAITEEEVSDRVSEDSGNIQERIKQEIADIRAQLQKRETERERLLNLYVTGAIRSDKELNQLMDKIEEREQRDLEEIADLQEKLEGVQDSAMRAERLLEIRDFGLTLLADPYQNEYTKNIVRTWISKHMRIYIKRVGRAGGRYAKRIERLEFI